MLLHLLIPRLFLLNALAVPLIPLRFKRVAGGRSLSFLAVHQTATAPITAPTRPNAAFVKRLGHGESTMCTLKTFT